jgi:hypothetical protein
MMNTGACAGVLGAHAYFQYTGERQEAYKHFGRQLQRRSLEFWSIFWDAEMMASFDPIMQQYVRHNGIWYTRHLPEEVFERAEQGAESAISSKEPATIIEAPVEQQPPFYVAPIEYAEDLRRINVESTLATIEVMEADRRELLQEAEYLLFFNAQRQYEYCHMATMDEDERHRRLQEIHLVDVAYNRLRAAADDIDIKLIHWRMSLRHKAVWEAATASSTTRTDSLADWLPEPQTITFETHKPTYSMGEIEKVQWQIAAEVKRFEEGYMDDRHPKERRERWRRDAEDGRAILRAADCVLFRLMKAREMVEEGGTAVKKIQEEEAEEIESGRRSGVGPATPDTVGEKGGAMGFRKEIEKTKVNGDKMGRTPAGTLDANKS